MARKPLFCAIAFFAFICWVIYLANSGSESVFFDFVRSIPLGDKIGHVGLFGLLALLANMGLSYRFLRWPLMQIGSLAVLVFSLGEEVTQAFNPNRTLDLGDATADVIGVAGATVISLWVMKRASRKSATDNEHS